MAWRYAGVDHLGSVSTLTDAGAGAVVERDSWGKRRNADGSDNTTCSITSQVDRGFTGQEMLDNLCLVNMNARVYDPSIGRFMAADSIVPNAMNTQDHNRYSYVHDNPLAFTDPTGHSDPFEWYNLTAPQIETAPGWGWRQYNFGAISWGDGGGGGGGDTHGPGQRGPEPYGAEGGGSDGIETVVVTHARWPVMLYPTILAYPAFLLPGGNSNGGGSDSSTCSQGVLNVANGMRDSAFAGSVAGLIITGAGISGMVEGAPLAIPTEGGSEIPGGTVTLAGVGVMSISGYADLGGAALQSYQTGSWEPLQEPLQWASVGAAGGFALGGTFGSVLVAGTVTSFSLMGGPPAHLHCH